jgi:hypothetical protein
MPPITSQTTLIASLSRSVAKSVVSRPGGAEGWREGSRTSAAPTVTGPPVTRWISAALSVSRRWTAAPTVP